MLAYQVTPDGYGYSTAMSENNKFFWSRLTADKFCEAQLYTNLVNSIGKYVEYNSNALALGTTYNTIRRDTAFSILNRYVSAEHPQSLLQLAVEVLDLEPYLRAIIPGKRHPFHFNSKNQFNDLIWLCIRIRKQFKMKVIS